jgi:hypothetical protein
MMHVILNLLHISLLIQPFFHPPISFRDIQSTNPLFNMGRKSSGRTEEQQKAFDKERMEKKRRADGGQPLKSSTRTQTKFENQQSFAQESIRSEDGNRCRNESSP